MTGELIASFVCSCFMIGVMLFAFADAVWSVEHRKLSPEVERDVRELEEIEEADKLEEGGVR